MLLKKNSEITRGQKYGKQKHLNLGCMFVERPKLQNFWVQVYKIQRQLYPELGQHSAHCSKVKMNGKKLSSNTTFQGF